jgi:HEAT repeat protein
VVMTPKAKESEYVTYEWAFAWGAGVRVIPILLKPTELHPRLEALQYLDFTNRMARPWDKLIEALQEAADAYTPHTVRVPRNVPSVVKQAVAALDSASPAERKAAVETLAQTDHPAAREALARAVQHPVQNVRIMAALALIQFKDAHAVPGLIEALRDKHGDMRFYMREVVAKGLKHIGYAAVPGLLDALCDKDDDVRNVAAKALGQIGDAAAVPGLLKALRDENWHVREAAARALGQIGDAAAVPALVDALRDADPDRRETLAKALKQIGDAAVPGLLNTLRDKDSNVRWYAA